MFTGNQPATLFNIDKFLSIKTQFFSAVNKFLHELVTDRWHSRQQSEIGSIRPGDKGILIIFPFQLEDQVRAVERAEERNF